MLPIVVPSRARAHNIPKLRQLLPEAHIVVSRRDERAYARVVPTELLVVHDCPDRISAIRNWCIGRFGRLFFLDDDFQRLRVMTGSRNAVIRDPATINCIIQSTAQVAIDLGASAFGFNHGLFMFRIAHKDPFHLTGKLNQAWGVLSPELRLDGSLARWSDFDLSLAILAEERRLLIDNRFFFDCGAVLAGRGGIAGTITSQEVLEGERALKRRWGAYWVTPQGSDSRRVGRKGIKRKSPHVK